MKTQEFLPPSWVRRVLQWLHPEETLEEPGRRRG